MKDKNNQLHIAVVLQNSAISFYDVTIHEDDIIGIVSAEEYEQLQHESHVNKKDLRAYIDKEGKRKIGAFDKTQPSQYHFWSEKKLDWDIAEEKKLELKAQEKQQKILELESQIKQLEQKLLIIGMRGKDTTKIIEELDVLEAELASLK